MSVQFTITEEQADLLWYSLGVATQQMDQAGFKGGSMKVFEMFEHMQRTAKRVETEIPPMDMREL